MKYLHNDNVVLIKLITLIAAFFINGLNINCQPIKDSITVYDDNKISDLYITVNARNRYLQLIWRNFHNFANYIVVTNYPGIKKFEQKEFTTDVTDNYASSSFSPSLNSTNYDDLNASTTTSSDNLVLPAMWTYQGNNGTNMIENNVLFSIRPRDTNGWTTTDIKYDYSLMYYVNANTSCYGYYAYFINENGDVLDKFCMKIYPRWMNDMREHIKHFRPHQLFLPGTHDSASYRKLFNTARDTRVTKYTLTQDDDVKGQLMAGARYIDIRVGYYRSAQPMFWANHGISRQHPLKDILHQIREFVEETNEIVIVDIQEFPVGFMKYEVHEMLVHHIINEIGDYLADPIIGWRGTLNDIWKQGRNIILSYDFERTVYDFSHVLWPSVEQKWPNVQSLELLKDSLFRNHKNLFNKFSYRPISDMAELTPDPWGAITDRYGGLRKMADQVNLFVSKWYLDELGTTANVVAVDFLKGTYIVEAAIYWNKKRVHL